jgi:hypothetical protein
MRTIRVEINDATVYLPIPTRTNKVARVIYRALIVILTTTAVSVLFRTVDPLAWYGVFWIAMPLPAFYFAERAIKRTQWSESEAVRGLLLGAEIIIPLCIMLALPAMPAILNAYSITPTINELAMIDITLMFVIGLGSIPANYTWARYQLGLER